MAGAAALGGAAAEGPIEMRNPGLLLDVALQPGAEFEQVGPALGTDRFGAHRRAPWCLLARNEPWWCCSRRLTSIPTAPNAPTAPTAPTAPNRLDRARPREQAVPAGWNAFAYVYSGAGRIGGAEAAREQAVVLGPGDGVAAKG
jgi:hypothetical protein